MSDQARVSRSAPRSPALFIGRTDEIERVVQTVARVHLALVYGVAGVGKSAFMLRVAEVLIATSGGALAYHRCRVGESVNSVVIALCEQIAPGQRAHDEIDPVERISRLSASGPLVVCLDDAHLAGDSGLSEVLIQVATQRRSISVLVASREALPISPLAVDHVICRLGPLGVAETRALWAALEQLYGPAAGSSQRIEAVLARGETPLVLKQMFAGQLDSDDVLQLGELPAITRRLLTRSCAFRRPVPMTALHEPADDPAVREAMQFLIRRFLVEPVADRVQLHDVVRDAVTRSALAPRPEDHAFCLAYYLAVRAHPDLDQMERLHHAVASGRDELAHVIIAEHASDLRRYPPGSAVVERDLGAAIDTLSERVELPPAILLFRQRIWARQGEVAKAYMAARAFIGRVPAVEFDLADMAAALGRYDDAIAHATTAASDTRLDPFMRAFACAVLADAHRAQGRLDRSLEILADAGRLLAPLGAVGRLTTEALLAMCAFDHQRYVVAAAHLAEGSSGIASLEIPFSMPLLASLERAVAAANGTAPTCEPANIYDETAFFRSAARLLHVQELLFLGDVTRAAELARATVEQGEARGFLPIAWWGTWLWGRAARVLGRAHEVALELAERHRAASRAGHRRAMLYIAVELASCHLATGAPERVAEIVDGVRSDASADAGLAARLAFDGAQAAWLLGHRPPCPDERVIDAADGYERAHARLGRVDLLLWDGQLARARTEATAVREIARDAGWHWIACRARIAAAEALFREGRLHAAELELAAVRDETSRRGYEVDHLRTLLVGAGIARARGDRETARAGLARVAARAHELRLAIECDAAEAGIAEASPMVESPGSRLAQRLHLTERATIGLVQASTTYRITTAHAAEIEWTQFGFGGDLLAGRVWIGSRWIDLSRRGALLEMVRVLLRSPGELVPVADLVRYAWNVEYHPLRHHSRVTTTMSRVRKLLGDHVVQGSRDGYRLVPAEPWFVIDAIEPPRGPVSSSGP